MALMTGLTSSPSSRPRSSADSVVSTEAISTGPSTFADDITASLFTDVTLPTTLFLAPYSARLVLTHTVGYVDPAHLPRGWAGAIRLGTALRRAML